MEHSYLCNNDVLMNLDWKIHEGNCALLRYSGRACGDGVGFTVGGHWRSATVAQRADDECASISGFLTRLDADTDPLVCFSFGRPR